MPERLPMFTFALVLIQGFCKDTTCSLALSELINPRSTYCADGYHTAPVALELLEGSVGFRV